MNKAMRLLLISSATAVALSALAPATMAAEPAAATPTPTPAPSRAPYGPGFGYGMGPGMMGGYGMGPGMMGGYGMGPGMMGGNGMGPGMMGEFWSQKLNLTNEQQDKIDKIMNETRGTHWAIMGQFMDDRAKLRDLYLAPQRDEAAIERTYQEMAGLRQKIVDTAMDAHRRMDAVLTPEQHKQVEAIRRGVMGY
ncbi:MAG: Spy/CpxP family protein refolding chaperone [Thiobacillaceae bacterium]|jgi:Spy/CpxP family protein refolding chaperone